MFEMFEMFEMFKVKKRNVKITTKKIQMDRFPVILKKTPLVGSPSPPHGGRERDGIMDKMRPLKMIRDIRPSCEMRAASEEIFHPFNLGWCEIRSLFEAGSKLQVTKS